MPNKTIIKSTSPPGGPSLVEEENKSSSSLRQHSILQSKAPPISVKILIIGDNPEEKRKFIEKFIDDPYPYSFISTVGIDFRIKTFSVDNTPVKLTIGDTAGQEKFRTITPYFFNRCDGIFILYDITQSSSFDIAGLWRYPIKEYAPENIPIYLVGNHCHLEKERVISKLRAQEFATQNNMGYIECSSKENINVTEAFHQLTRDILKKKPNIQEEKKEENSSSRFSGCSMM